MYELEFPVVSLAAQGDLVHDEWCRQSRQTALQYLGPVRECFCGEPARQSQMEPKFFHHIRVAPLSQKHLLPGAETSHATARKLGIFRRSAKLVEFADAVLSHPLQRPQIAAWDQRQKSAKRHQLQSIALGRRKRCCKFRCGRFKGVERMALLQLKGRFQGAMKSVFARCHRDVAQTGQGGLWSLATPRDIPTQPSCAKVGQRPLRRNIVHRKSRI